VSTTVRTEIAGDDSDTEAKCNRNRQMHRYGEPHFLPAVEVSG
jgi:hypothetical protein